MFEFSNQVLHHLKTRFASDLLRLPLIKFSSSFQCLSLKSKMRYDVITPAFKQILAICGLFMAVTPRDSMEHNVVITPGGIDCSTLRNSIFQGRPVYQDEGGPVKEIQTNHQQKQRKDQVQELVTR